LLGCTASLHGTTPPQGAHSTTIRVRRAGTPHPRPTEAMNTREAATMTSSLVAPSRALLSPFLFPGGMRHSVREGRVWERA